MSREELEKKIIEFVAISYKRNASELSIATSFKSDLSGASIQMVGLVSLIENELDVMVPLPMASACETVKDLADKVESLM